MLSRNERVNDSCDGVLRLMSEAEFVRVRGVVVVVVAEEGGLRRWDWLLVG